jgi:hypothetical protein
MEKENFIVQLVKSPWRLKMFFIKNLPMAFISGLKVVSFDQQSASVRIPFNYVNKNPFRSMYFGSQSIAAELSTGLLAMAAIYQVSQNVSMLVLTMKSSFLKKATSAVTFTCEDGTLFAKTVQIAIETGEGQTITSKSIGKNEEGIIVSEFEFTWTFKLKTNRA